MAYIYSHTRLDTGDIFYIGLGTGGIEDGYKRAFQKNKRNVYWNRITKKTEYRVDIIEDNLDRDYAIEREIYWIKKYGRKNVNEGTLVNVTCGGDGGDTISKNPNKEIILKKISISNSGKNNPNYGGKFHNDEYMKKQILSNSPYTYKILNIETNEVYTFFSENQVSKKLNIPRSTFSCYKNTNKVFKKKYRILEVIQNTLLESKDIK